MTPVDPSRDVREWTGGQWIALMARGISPRASKVVPESGWPAPETATSDRLTVHLDGSLLLENKNGTDCRLDARALLRAYAERGERLLPQLRGSFALLILDDSRLIALRDPLGTHPLFYTTTNGEIAISPSMGRLTQTTTVSRTVDPVFLVARMVQSVGRPEETFFSNVLRIPAGHALRVSDGRVSVSRYWDPATQGRSDLSIEAALEHFPIVLERAVDRCLDGNRAGIFLSGGLDSAAVAASATIVGRKRGLEPPVALSFFSPDPGANEQATQRAVAKALDLPHLTATPPDAVGEGSLLLLALAQNATTPGLLASPLHPIYDSLALRAIQQGCGVLLGGEGGDECLMPRPEYLADRMRSLDMRSYAALARAWHCYYPPTTKRDFAYGIFWKWGARPILRSAGRAGLGKLRPAKVRSVQRQRILDSLPSWLAPSPTLRCAFVDSALDHGLGGGAHAVYVRSRRELLTHPNVAEYCEESFALRRRLGIPLRAPFHDGSLVQFLFNLPETHLVANGKAKSLVLPYLARELGYTGVPWARTVYGDRFMEELVRREGRAAWKTLGGARLLAELGVVDDKEVSRIIDGTSLAADPLAEALNLWHIMTVESWLRSRLDYF